MSVPEVGRVYDVTVRGRVTAILGFVYVIEDTSGRQHRIEHSTLPASATWTEVGPEYVVGGLYMDAGRPAAISLDAREPRVRVRTGDPRFPWHRVGDGSKLARWLSDEAMVRPLTRLYREGEVPS